MPSPFAGPLGHDNQIRVQATPVAPLAASALNFDPENTASDSSKQATAGTNAIVTIDGVPSHTTYQQS